MKPSTDFKNLYYAASKDHPRYQTWRANPYRAVFDFATCRRGMHGACNSVVFWEDGVVEITGGHMSVGQQRALESDTGLWVGPKSQLGSLKFAEPEDMGGRPIPINAIHAGWTYLVDWEHSRMISMGQWGSSTIYSAPHMPPNTSAQVECDYYDKDARRVFEKREDVVEFFAAARAIAAMSTEQELLRDYQTHNGTPLAIFLGLRSTKPIQFDVQFARAAAYYILKGEMNTFMRGLFTMKQTYPYLTVRN